MSIVVIFIFLQNQYFNFFLQISNFVFLSLWNVSLQEDFINIKSIAPSIN